jgi:signal transduction histidine kinase
MCGAGKDELLGMRVEALLMTNPSRLLQPGTTVECNVRRLDGSEFAAAAVISSMTVNDEPHALLVLNDVSERKLLEREILEVSSLEQQRIGNDLHDGLGQELTGVALMLRALARRIDREYPNANTEVGEIVALVNHSIESTRALARGLSPVSIERGGLLPALQTLVLRARAAYGITVLIRRYIRRPLRLEADEATHLYRIVQEALTNAVRHGRASRISIAIASDARYINISIRDNGRGFAAGNARRGGIGLKTMHYRAQMLQGELTIGAARGGGTVVRCRCPQGSGAGRDGGMQRLPSELQVTRIFPGS